MSEFGLYAEFYDALYSGKAYEAEAAYVEALIREHAGADAASILDLGCGTGRHAIEMAARGFSVHGVDLSENMVAIAEERRLASPDNVRAAVDFSVGDVRTLRLGRRFDIVMSLFHVASYQTANQDFATFLATALAHLQPGGLLIFDAWYGPAVLTQKPEVRIKRVETGSEWVIRIAEPVSSHAEDCVTVQYEIVRILKATGQATRLTESHKMRYFFVPELRLMAEEAGLGILAAREWLSQSAPTADSWSVCVVAKEIAASPLECGSR